MKRLFPKRAECPSDFCKCNSNGKGIYKHKKGRLECCLSSTSLAAVKQYMMLETWCMGIEAFLSVVLHSSGITYHTISGSVPSCKMTD
jgi:hypothetical protein